MLSESWYIILLFCVVLTNGSEYPNFEILQHPESFSHYIQKYLEDRNTNLSERCSKELDLYSKALPFTLWAIKMYDASSRTPAGILSGNAGDLGAFDQCLAVKGTTREGTIYGKYCAGSIIIRMGRQQPVNNAHSSKAFPYSHSQLQRRYINKTLKSKPPKIALDIEVRYATCSPSSCSAMELQQFYSGMDMNIYLSDELCQVMQTDSEPSTADGVTKVILFVVLGVMAISTTYDIILFYSKRTPIFTFLVAFSIISNGKELLQSSTKPRPLLCLHGIRAFSIMWIILAHRYYFYALFPLVNYLDYSQSLKAPHSMYLLGGQVAIDTFLVVAGLVISYSYMNSVANGERFQIWKYYLRRFLRLTPALIIVILVYATILKNLGSGPYWGLASEQLSQPCIDHWWSALLYVQNYVNPSELCVDQSWYLSVEMQLFLLSPIILIPLTRKPKFTLIAVGLLTFCCVLSSALVVWINDIRAIAVIGGSLVTEERYNSQFRVPTHTRASPWLIGFILGYIIYHSKKSKIDMKIKENLHLQLLSLGLWGVSLAIMTTCVFGPYYVVVGDYNKLASTFHLSLVRPAWSIALGWVIFACAHDFGGPINWFLCLPVLQFISKLSYSMYLLHLLVMSLITFTRRSGLVFEELDLLYSFWGDFIFTLLISIVWVLAFEYPLATLDKIIFGERNKDEQLQQHQTGNDEKLKQET